MSSEDNAAGFKQATSELRNRYLNLPVGAPDGCRSAFSNHSHILVNFLEYGALRDLLGVAGAAVIGSVPYYRTICRIALKDREELKQLFTECGLIPPERPPTTKRFRTPPPKKS